MDPISRPQYNLLFGAIGQITVYKNTLDSQRVHRDCSKVVYGVKMYFWYLSNAVKM
jgi:hypothetical protein